MTATGRNTDELGWKARLMRLGLALLGIVAFLVISVTLENDAGIPFKTTYRVAGAVVCLILILKVGADYPRERWHRVAFCIALLFNIGMFFSPLANLPASKGDWLFFGAPDAAIMFAARTVTYRVTDDHQRAVRQQMILGLILAVAFCVMILSMMFLPARYAR